VHAAVKCGGPHEDCAANDTVMPSQQFHGCDSLGIRMLSNGASKAERFKVQQQSNSILILILNSCTPLFPAFLLLLVPPVTSSSRSLLGKQRAHPGTTSEPPKPI